MAANIPLSYVALASAESELPFVRCNTQRHKMRGDTLGADVPESRGFGSSGWPKLQALSGLLSISELSPMHAYLLQCAGQIDACAIKEQTLKWRLSWKAQRSHSRHRVAFGTGKAWIQGGFLGGE